jgi:hypothetical protein
MTRFCAFILFFLPLVFFLPAQLLVGFVYVCSGKAEKGHARGLSINSGCYGGSGK